jgi:uncharacterized protein (DUF58 family)
VHPLGPLLDPQLLHRVARLAPGARRVTVGGAGGLHRSPLKGASVEFRQRRAYVAGDEPRRIDWRVLGRTDRVFVKEYDDETDLHATLVLDASGSMAYGGAATKLDYAARLVAAMGFLLLLGGEAAGLVVARTDAPPVIPPSAASRQLSRIIDVLEGLTPAGDTRTGDALRSAAARRGRRSLVIVVSDFLLDPQRLQDGLARLAHARHEVVLVRTLHRDEIGFRATGWTSFAGLEGERPLRADAARLRQTYLANKRRHDAQLRALCAATGAELLETPTDLPLFDAVVTVARRRGGGGARCS